MRLAAIALSCLLFLVLPAQAADGFVDGIDDLPLMAGLVSSGEPTVF
ncbi:MAG: hypothetical protein JNL71_15095, partial [Rhodospirillales bacterium]|nr:hypothetical protein [Rhodospirillales bacterium]